MTTRTYGAQSMIAPLRRVIVRAPDAAFGAADPERWHYTGRPDLARARAEHAAFVELVRHSGAEVIYHEEPLHDRADAVFVHDDDTLTFVGKLIPGDIAGAMAFLPGTRTMVIAAACFSQAATFVFARPAAALPLVACEVHDAEITARMSMSVFMNVRPVRRLCHGSANGRSVTRLPGQTGDLGS